MCVGYCVYYSFLCAFKLFKVRITCSLFIPCATDWLSSTNSKLCHSLDPARPINRRLGGLKHLKQNNIINLLPFHFMAYSDRRNHSTRRTGLDEAPSFLQILTQRDNYKYSFIIIYLFYSFICCRLESFTNWYALQIQWSNRSRDVEIDGRLFILLPCFVI